VPENSLGAGQNLSAFECFYRGPADIEPAESELRITLAPLSSPHRSRVVESLCASLNKTKRCFPVLNFKCVSRSRTRHLEGKNGQVSGTSCQEF
jgi:hypothetical protein